MSGFIYLSFPAVAKPGEPPLKIRQIKLLPGFQLYHVGEKFIQRWKHVHTGVDRGDDHARSAFHHVFPYLHSFAHEQIPGDIRLIEEEIFGSVEVHLVAADRGIVRRLRRSRLAVSHKKTQPSAPEAGGQLYLL